MANDAQVYTTGKLVAELQLNRRDFVRKVAYTDQISLALLNRAALTVFSTAAPEQVGAGLFKKGVSITLAAFADGGLVGDLPDGTTNPIVLRPVDGYLSAASTRPVEILTVSEYWKRQRRSSLAGTINFPIAGFDLYNKKVYVGTAATYDGALKIDYIRYPKELKIDTILDIGGTAYDEDVNPDWETQFSLAILEKAIDMAKEMEEKLGKEDVTADNLMAVMQARISHG